MDSVHRFVALSAALTGYDSAELHGTGMVKTYYDTLSSVVGGAILGELLLAWSGVVSGASGEPDAILTGLKATILSDSKLGPVAKNLTALWYMGQWNEMPGSWRAVHGAAATDITRVVSAEAYREGLMWDAIGAHPLGAKQQGYGAWSLPPKGVSDV